MTDASPFDLSADVAEALWCEEVDSTNSFLSSLPPEPGGRVVASWHQTAGRGRLGRNWVALPGRGLSFSVELWSDTIPHPLHPEWLGAVGMLAGASLVEAMRGHVSSTVALKWPNDVEIEGRKVAGILGEMPQPGRVILGVGLNVFHQEDELPTPRSTSLWLHGVETNDALSALVHTFLSTLRQALIDSHSGLTPGVTSWLKESLSTLGQRVRVDYPDGSSRTGEARDLDQQGRLVVIFDDSGSTEVVSSADVWHLRQESA